MLDIGSVMAQIGLLGIAAGRPHQSSGSRRSVVGANLVFALVRMSMNASTGQRLPAI
ncbi:MAG TPA: hypothetical protein VM223_22215 [Planctomycetota bacterium]|nr:hypothetical protein [Planctomycetota bacterium]